MSEEKTLRVIAYITAGDRVPGFKERCFCPLCLLPVLFDRDIDDKAFVLSNKAYIVMIKKLCYLRLDNDTKQLCSSIHKERNRQPQLILVKDLRL